MHAVGAALRAMREQTTAIKGIAPDGSDVVFRLDTDLDSGRQESVKSVMAVRMAASEFPAVVPYQITEEITVHPDGGRDPLEIVDAVVSALKGRTWIHGSCVIHRHSHVSTSTSPGRPGLERDIVVQWSGEASCR